MFLIKLKMDTFKDQQQLIDILSRRSYNHEDLIIPKKVLRKLVDTIDAEEVTIKDMINEIKIYHVNKDFDKDHGY
ncbi:unnamed protein product [marine sediment metagenome]|uniref:Uncharacterized protein n=1 Tax=marine sediment metagenome TaxID=412755 RepID=X1BJ49_9ZZZZ